MNGFLEKLSSYEILNNILPGAFFGMAAKLLWGIDISMQNIGETFLLFYFIGLGINRIGSLIVEPVLKSLHFIKFAPHDDFAVASKTEQKLYKMSEINNNYRALLTCCLLLLAIPPVQSLMTQWLWLKENKRWVGLVALFFLLLFAYKKQTKYVCNHVRTTLMFEKEKRSDAPRT